MADPTSTSGAAPEEQRPRLFEQAVALHRRGWLADARRLYEEILARDPTHFEALHLAGVVALQTQQAAEGVALITRAIALNDRDPGAHYNLGLGLQALGRHAEAIASYDRAIALKPDHAAAHNNRGITLCALQRHAEAVASYDAAIALRANFAEAHGNRGNVLRELKRFEDALASYDTAIALRADHAETYHNRGGVLLTLQRQQAAIADYDKAIALKPDLAEAYYSRGIALSALQRHADAIASYDQAIVLNPGHADAYNNRGSALLELQLSAAALASYDAAIALKPDHAEAYNNRGMALRALDRPAEALASFATAITLKPDYAEAYENRGSMFLLLKRHDDAIASYDSAIALKATYTEAHNNRGIALRELNRLEEAVASFDRAIALEADLAAVHWSKSLCLLGLGRFDEGWQHLEWRKKLEAPSGNRSCPQPVWLGQTPLAGKTLFIHCEQGFGDTLQFCRYLALLPDPGHIVLEVQRPLVRLLRSLRQPATVIGEGDPPPPFDLHCAMLSLPLACGAGRGTLAAEVPYLRADPAATARWRGILAELPGLHVGLCWAGDPRRYSPAANAIDRRRSISLSQYGALAAVPGIRFVSLQKGEAAAQTLSPPTGLRLQDWTDALADFADTAALIEALDLVITVDTAVAHLAGALGKPVWIVSRFDADWRWMTDRADSPWYPTVRLFRQPTFDDWDSVIASVATALRAWSDAPAARHRG